MVKQMDTKLQNPNLRPFTPAEGESYDWKVVFYIKGKLKGKMDYAIRRVFLNFDIEPLNREEVIEVIKKNEYFGAVYRQEFIGVESVTPLSEKQKTQSICFTNWSINKRTKRGIRYLDLIKNHTHETVKKIMKTDGWIY